MKKKTGFVLTYYRFNACYKAAIEFNLDIKVIILCFSKLVLNKELNFES